MNDELELEAASVGWRPFFETSDGSVLAGSEPLESPEAAAIWAQTALRVPDEFLLVTTDGALVPASLADPSRGVTVE